MELILWRHADAAPAAAGESDLQRVLTAEGERQAGRVAGWLDARLARSTRVLVSPAVRCRQTVEALGRRYRTVEDLAPGATAEAVLRAARWPDAGEPVLVVGHQPTLGMAASLALTGAAHAWSVKKGSVWWLRHRLRDNDSSTILRAVQSPDLL